MLQFEPISLERQEHYLGLHSVSKIAASEYSFINLWAWAQEFGLEWAWENSIVWIRQTRPYTVFWAPVGSVEDTLWKEEMGKLGVRNPSFIRVPQELVTVWENHFAGQIDILEARGQWDYLYAVKELVELSGNRYHKKKNLLNQFRKRNDYEYIDINPQIIKQTREMQERWCVWRDCQSSETLSAENRAIDRVLGSWEELRNNIGGALMVNGKIVAFCIAEKFTSDTLIIHFEKGFTEFAGIYQAINQMFLAAHKDFAFVNREQDLDEEGLRKAKLSYHPIRFVRKYLVTIE